MMKEMQYGHPHSVEEGTRTRDAWDLNHDKIGNGHALYYKGYSYRMTSQYLYSDIG